MPCRAAGTRSWHWGLRQATHKRHTSDILAYINWIGVPTKAHHLKIIATRGPGSALKSCWVRTAKGIAMTAPAPDAPVDFATLGQVVHEEILRLRGEEQEIVHRESEIQTMLAKRRFPNRNEILGKRYYPEHLGAPKESPKDLPPATAPNSSSKVISINHVSEPKMPHVPRPGLINRISEDWGTQEGKVALLALSLRDLGKRYSVSHSSISENPFFRQKIQPLRQRTKNAHRTANWIENNARSRS